MTSGCPPDPGAQPPLGPDPQLPYPQVSAQPPFAPTGYQPSPYGQPQYGQPPYGQLPPWAPGQAYGPVQGPSNGLGTAGGVVGIVGAALCWFPYVGLILGVVGLVLGGFGLQRANRLGGAAKGMAITGIVCGAVAVVVGALILGAIYTRVAPSP